MLKILHVLWSLDRGGAEILLLDMVRACRHDRFQHSVCCLGPGGSLKEAFAEAGAPVHVLGRRNAAHTFRTLLNGARLVQRLRPDITHVHRTGTDVWGEMIARLGGAQCVIATEHAPFEYYVAAGLRFLGPRTYVRRRLGQRDARIVAISDAVAKDLLKHRLARSDQLVVIYNGLDTNRFRPARIAPLSGNVVRIVTAARLIPRKRHDVLFRAVAQLRSVVTTPMRLRIAGRGPEEDRLRRLAKELGLGEIVEFAGEVRDMPSFLQEADIFVLPSVHEGFGIALAEAMSCALPVVASDTCGLPDIVEDGMNGLLFHSGDPSALAERLRVCLDAPERARRMGLAARETVLKRFSLEQMVSRYEALYEEVLAGSAHTAG